MQLTAMTAKLVVNGRFLNQPITGVQRFAVEICKQLVMRASHLEIVAPAGTDCPHDQLKPLLKTYGTRKGAFWEQTDLVSYMRQNRGFLLNLCNSAPIRYNKNVVAIHDLGVYVNHRWYNQSFVWWYRFMTPKILRRAKAILTVSNSSKEEILRLFNIDKGKTHVVYNGVPDRFGLESPVSKEKLILHVGTYSERKNLNFIIESFNNANTNGYKLVFCGNTDENLSDSISRYYHSNKIEFRTGVSDEELNLLYSKARYIVCGSHYEGFGLPVLEGIVNGVTPILSDIPVFRELYELGSLFFHPERLNELTEIFSKLPEEYSYPSDEHISMYKEKFSYQASAQKIIKLTNKL
ncbi:MAG: glycosyltransferase family 1 protein [Flavobacteriales bacterium]|nr:glycosyltransferase family 1 protein [Flavobacteriales bacterium]